MNTSKSLGQVEDTQHVTTIQEVVAAHKGRNTSMHIRDQRVSQSLEHLS